MDVMLLNDTGNISHVGCRAVSDAHARMLGRSGHHVKVRHFVGTLGRFGCANPEDGIRRVLGDDALQQQIDSVDAVVVNGEGTIHHGAGTEYFAILGAAQTMGKPTLLVNAVFQEAPGFESVLHRLQDFTVRDAHSQTYARSLGVRCRVVPDSCIEAEFDTAPAWDLGGSYALTDWHHERDRDVGLSCLKWASRTDRHCEFLPLHSSDSAAIWRSFPAVLSTADIVVTARHHGVYLSAIAGVPFVALGSNTFKMEGLLSRSGGIAVTDPHVDAIRSSVDWASRNRPAFARFFEDILEKKPLTTFSALGATFDPGGAGIEVQRLHDDVRKRLALDRVDLAYMMQRRSTEMRMASRLETSR